MDFCNFFFFFFVLKIFFQNFIIIFVEQRKSGHKLQSNLKNLPLIFNESSMNIQQTFILTEVTVSLIRYKKNSMVNFP